MFYQQLLNSIIKKALKIILLLIGAEISKKTVAVLLKKTKIKGQRLETIRNLIANASKIIINFIVLTMILAELGVNIAPLVTGAGIIGLAIGFGAKSLAADFIAGFFIILENQFNVGDEIEINKNKGRVIKISLRTATLIDKDKKVYIVPNSSIKTVVKYPKKAI